MADDWIDWERLDRFIRGDGAPEERANLERWVNADPRRRSLADAMRTVGSRNNDDARRWNAQSALRDVRRKLRSGRPVGRLPRLSVAASSNGPRLFEWSLLTAGFAAIVLLAILSVRGTPTSVPPSPELRAREIVTGRGQRASVLLGDGSRVVLSPGSRLRIPAELADDVGGHRTVWLDGEAFFSVRHDSTRAFVVGTPHGSAEDLGTEFVVNTYPEVHGMRLAVREGRVAVRPNGDSAGTLAGKSSTPASSLVSVLDRGDIARVSQTGAVSVARHQDVAELFAEAEGSLVLSATPLRDAIPRLERWYDIRIRVGDAALLSRKVTGTFRDNAATEALGVIALALECKTKWHQNQVTLVPDRERGENQ